MLSNVAIMNAGLRVMDEGYGVGKTVGALSNYVVTQRESLAMQDLDSLLAGQVTWSAV